MSCKNTTQMWKLYGLLTLPLVLNPEEIVNLQLVSHRLFQITRDNNLWRALCFENSSWETLRRRRNCIAASPAQQPLLQNIERALANREPAGSDNTPKVDTQAFKTKANERIRIMANWDPSYPDEKIDWYTEYIHRSAPINISWVQQPLSRESLTYEPMDIQGIGIYNPPGEEGTSIVVGPLEDGSVCLWDVSRCSERQGKIIGRSISNALTLDGSASGIRRSRIINPGVTECVSVDSHCQKVYIAVQNGK